jgi:hypothetical protein
MPKRVKVYGCEKCRGYVNGLGICKQCGHDHRPPKVEHEPQPDPVPSLPSPADLLQEQPSLEAILGGVDPAAFSEPDSPATQALAKPSVSRGLAGDGRPDWEQAAEALKAEYRAEMEMLAGYRPSPRPPSWGQMLRNCGRA